MVEMSREDFEDAVRDALDSIPPELGELMDNVVVLVEDDGPEDEPALLGLYEGTPLTERTDAWFGSLPDRITVFRNPTLAVCHDRAEVVEGQGSRLLAEIGRQVGPQRRDAALITGEDDVLDGHDRLSALGSRLPASGFWLPNSES